MTTNPYRALSTESLIAAREVNAWDLADITENPDGWAFPDESRAFVEEQLRLADAELERRNKLRSNHAAPSWPDPRAELDDLKRAADLVPFIESIAGVRFERRGKRVWARCPLPGHGTTDVSPSFTVEPERQLFHCFGCAAGGDVFSFVMAMRDVSFSDAVDIVARQVGIERPRRQVKPASRIVRSAVRIG